MCIVNHDDIARLQIGGLRRQLLTEEAKVDANSCRFNRRFRHPGTAGCVGGGSGNRPVTVHGPGLEWLLLPGLALEAIPGVGVLPFWSLVVGAIAVLGTPRRKFDQR